MPFHSLPKYEAQVNGGGMRPNESKIRKFLEEIIYVSAELACCQDQWQD
jgi:hypothetical protein